MTETNNPSLIFATNNQSKLAEVRALAEEYGFAVLSLADIGLQSDPAETGQTFEENARIKLSSALSHIAGQQQWVAADDSGISIDYLDGAPGVYTRRWAGHEMTDQEIIDYTLRQLRDVPYDQRGAKLISAVALGHGDNPTAIRVFAGQVEGRILQKADVRRAAEGFPFQQLFFVPETGRMLGDTTDIPSDTIEAFLTHRQRAFQKVFKYINDMNSLRTS